MPVLSTKEQELVSCIVEAFRPQDLGLDAATIAARGVQFVESLGNSGSERVQEVVRILRFLDVALVGVDKSRRDQVRERLTEMENRSGLFGLLPQEARDLARFAQRLALILIYGTLDAQGRPPAAVALGYDVFDDRPRGVTANIPKEPLLPRESFVLPDQPLPDHEYDVVVVGSGSAGAVLVRRLVEDHGLDVMLVESGNYVPESVTPAQPHLRSRRHAHDEIEALSLYFKHSGLQLTTGHSMFVFQAECLGGSSVVNNAVCFRMPDAVARTWKQEFGIGWAEGAQHDGPLKAAYDRIARDVGIESAEKVVLEGFLNPTADILRKGADALGRKFNPCAVNLSHDPKCLGCGYCNLTCAYLRKSSVLQTMLPAAAASPRGRLTVCTGRKAVKVVGEDAGGVYRAQGVLVRTKGPKPPFQFAAIRAKKVVICAGAVGTSSILGRTEALHHLPIGRRFSFNFGSPVHAEYAAPVRAFDGLQIGHFYDSGGAGFVIETWFNPPATQTLALPGWMDALHHNVSRYSHLACAAPLIGSTADSRINTDVNGEGEDIHVQLQAVDLARLKAGLLSTCELFFASEPAPSRVLLGSLDDWELTKDNFRARIARLQEFSEIQIGTGHPQGGNCLAEKSGASGGPGVVSPEFRVHGTDRLFAVDASVFPTSLGVNPHWTVMALAELASGMIAAQA